MTRKTMLVVALLCTVGLASAQDSVKRAIKSQGRAVFPELAKRMNVSGAVKVEVTVAPNGQVKMAKALGGHPLLIDSAVTAAKNTKYEPAAEETKELLVFNFTASN